MIPVCVDVLDITKIRDKLKDVGLHGRSVGQ